MPVTAIAFVNDLSCSFIYKLFSKKNIDDGYKLPLIIIIVKVIAIFFLTFLEYERLKADFNFDLNNYYCYYYLQEMALVMVI